MHATIRAIAGFVFLVFAAQAVAFDPFTSLVSKGISTAMDVRSKDDVKADVEIDAAATKKLLEHDDFKNVSLLVFARHATLVGYAKNSDARKKAEERVKADKRIRSLKNDILIGTPSGGTAGNMVLDEKIGLTLTAAKGINSVNMRWKVYGGEVFVTGVAATKGEAGLAIRKIKGLDGVKNVHSSLRIGKK